MKDIIPFKGMNHSGSDKVNYLGKYENIYVMDNHRLAPWCWMQHIDVSEKYYFLHVDWHYDTNSSGIIEFEERLNKKMFANDIDAYIDFSFQVYEKKYFISWDNYLPIFHRLNSELILKYYLFVTDNVSMKPEIIAPYEMFQPEVLLGKFKELDLDSNTKWIVNIDLDYFFLNMENQLFKRSMTDMIANLSQLILKLKEENKLDVFTIALSPQVCKENRGWKQSLEFLLKFETVLNLPVAKHLMKLCHTTI